MVFAGGALVFPGGRIDPGDHALAATIGATRRRRRTHRRDPRDDRGSRAAIGLHPAPSPRRSPRSARAARRRGVRRDPRRQRADARSRRAGAFRPLAARIMRTRASSTRSSFSPALRRARRGDRRRDRERPPVLDQRRRVARRGRCRARDDHLPRPAAISNGSRCSPIYDAAVAQARAHPIRTITPFVETRDGVRISASPTTSAIPSRRADDPGASAADARVAPPIGWIVGVDRDRRGGAAAMGDRSRATAGHAVDAARSRRPGRPVHRPQAHRAHRRFPAMPRAARSRRRPLYRSAAAPRRGRLRLCRRHPPDRGRRASDRASRPPASASPVRSPPHLRCGNGMSSSPPRERHFGARVVDDRPFRQL